MAPWMTKPMKCSTDIALKWVLKFAQCKFINRRFPLYKHNTTLYTRITASIKKRDICVHTAIHFFSILFDSTICITFKEDDVARKLNLKLEMRISVEAHIIEKFFGVSNLFSIYS